MLEMALNKKWLEKIIGREVMKFCYPGGRYNEETIQALKMTGFKYARTAVVMNTEKPKDPFRVATTVHVRPYRKEYKGRKWYEVATELYKKAIGKKNGYFHLWGHSWEIEEFNIWGELEKFFKKISKDTKLWLPKDR